MMAGKRKAPTTNPLTSKQGPSQATVIGIVLVVAFAAVVGFGVFWSNSSSSTLVPPNATSAGVPIGNQAAPKTVDIYVDFLCPFCKRFEQAAAPVLEELSSSGQAQIIYHPVAFLDRSSTTQYSTRAAAAAGCAAAANIFPQYEASLYAHQPAEGGDGLPNSKLIELGKEAGASGDFAECVNDQRYADWSADITRQALRDGVQGTPTVRVDGQDVDPSPEAIRKAVASN